MMHERRWQVEQALMKRYFPTFAAIESDTMGFYGYVRGPRTGRRYLVMAKVPTVRYPQMEPAVYIEPRIGNHWQFDFVNHDPRGKLSISRDTSWQPTRHSFANCVLCALYYLKEFDQ